MASSQPHWCRHHAFLSFRGADTRRGFTDHLYRALELAGIHTFRDDEIDRGANIAAELQRAIQDSQVSVVVFSKDYASSTWCLDELVKIMERTKNDGHVVLPVFYHVKPSDVRKQTGSFADSFSRHEENFKEEMDKVEEWRKALKDLPELAGMELKDWYESQFIQKIVDEVGRKLDRKALHIAPYAVGMDYRVKDLNMWLKDGSKDVGVAIICGMGGIGKTTIAKAAYNQNSDRFEGNSFLADIRQTSEQPNGVLHLQRKLISDILKGKTKKIYSVDDGLSKIKHVVCCKRVLIILDDVDHLDQFNTILATREWFHPGSRIIVTTRHESLLKGHYACEIFKVGELCKSESLELFSWHAFGQANPIGGFMELSRPLVQHCEGLPLALEALGSYLHGKGQDVWRSALHNLDVIMNMDGKIEKVLRISFDSLQVRDKSLFLHLACFFVGYGKDFTITVLDNCGFATRIEIQNLIDRCLVKFDENDKLMVHQSLRDMAFEIIREESLEEPGKRSRVLHKDAINILRRLTGTETIKGLMLNLPTSMEDESFHTKCRSNKKRCHVEDRDGNYARRRRLGFFTWKWTNFVSTSSASVSNEVDFKTEAFTRMHNLEILRLNNVKFSGGYEYFPKSLIWLSWRGFPLISIPTNFSLEYLVALDLQNSRLQHLWKRTRSLPKLKILDLSHSHGLMTTPDFSGVPNLERLILEDCLNLVEVEESIGDLQKLVFLNLKGCKNLTKLPKRIRNVPLQEIILDSCSKAFVHHANTSGNMKKLRLLWTKSWQLIIPLVSSRKILEPTRFSLANLPNCLRRLSFANCNLSEIPNVLCMLSSLTHLDLSENPIVNLPENMKGCAKLHTLLLDDCGKLLSIPELPPSLVKLHANACKSLKRITNLPNISTSLDLDFSCIEEFVEVQSLFNIKPLTSVGLEMIRRMGLFNLESIGSSSEVEMQSFFLNTTRNRKLPLQALYECGIFSTFLHGSKIPEFFRCKTMGNSVLSIIVPSRLNRKIRGLNICVLYGDLNAPNQNFWLTNGQYIKVSNISKGLTWTYSPVTMGIPKENEDMLWVSHWLFGDHELEVGDELYVSADGNMFSTIEFGIDFVYEQENKGKGVQSFCENITTEPDTPTSSSENVVSQHVIMLGSPEYQLLPGKYLLYNNCIFSSYMRLAVCQQNRHDLDISNGLPDPFQVLFTHCGTSLFVYEYEEWEEDKDGSKEEEESEDGSEE